MRKIVHAFFSWPSHNYTSSRHTYGTHPYKGYHLAYGTAGRLPTAFSIPFRIFCISSIHLEIYTLIRCLQFRIEGTVYESKLQAYK